MTTVTSEQFHDRIHDNHMYGLWELASQMTPHPMPKARAHIWKSELFESVLRDSGEVVPHGEERRSAAAVQSRPRRPLGHDEQPDRRDPDAAAR